MNTLALSALYLLQFALIFFVFIGIGMLIVPRPRRLDRAERLWNWIECHAAGFSASVLIVIVPGLFGLIKIPVLLPMFILPAIAGFVRYFRSRGETIGGAEKKIATRGDILLTVIALIIYFALNMNVLIGGMCPNMGQDTLWYHLSVPIQWALTGKAAAFPYVMPSNYPLGMEAIYSAILLVSNEILCSMIYCQVVMVLLAAMVVAAFRYASWPGALIVMGCIAPFTTTGAPVPPANDSSAALLLLVGFVRLGDSLKNTRAGIDDNLLTGFILGSAIAVKLTSIIFIAPMIFFWFVFSMGQLRFQCLAATLILFGAGIFIAYAPWGVRGFAYCGNPVFPLAKSVFPVKPEYQGMAEASARLNNSYPLTLSGIQKAVSDLPEKINYLLTASDVMFWLMLMTAFALIFHKTKAARFFGWTLLAFYGGFLIMKGHNEVGRYFSIGYPVAAPGIAIAFVLLIGQMKYHYRVLFTLVLISAATGIYLSKQITQANWTTIQWKFRPVLTRQAIERYAEHAEFGHNYLFYSKLRTLIEPDARVFLADEMHPYYLKRQCLWGDEVTILPFQQSWSAKTPAQMHEYLTELNMKYVVCLKNDIPLFHQMEESKMLRPIQFESAYSNKLGFWAVELRR